MTSNMPNRNVAIQALCREYLGKVRHIAARYGLATFVDDTIELNKQEKCKATEEECTLLAKIVDEERISRTDVPKILGKSYRECNEDGTFDKITKFKRVGIYSRISTLLMKKG